MAKNGKTPKSKPIDSDRETRVLLEDMSRNITRIAEAQTATAEKVSKMEKLVDRIPAMESAVDTISTAVMQISKDVKKLDSKADAIDTRLKAVENKVDENLANHDKRITKLEEKVLV